ncbi:uncharacterized protein LOC143452663 [Clavelina lepadiformis]|uniref:uncharacterized protein LOC143452663 n=1 Tax=Clavelina lepadiformis TaxID=159417 RepID=UPI004041414E
MESTPPPPYSPNDPRAYPPPATTPDYSPQPTKTQTRNIKVSQRKAPYYVGSDPPPGQQMTSAQRHGKQPTGVGYNERDRPRVTRSEDTAECFLMGCCAALLCCCYSY